MNLYSDPTYRSGLGDLYDEERKANQDTGAFMGGLKAGLYGLGQSWYDTKAALERSVGLDSWAKENEQSANEMAAKAEGAGWMIPHFGDIHGLGDAASWALGNLGEAAPLVGTLMVGGLVGGGLGAAAEAAGWGGRAIEGADAAAQALRAARAARAVKVGQYAGTVLPYASTTVGQTYHALRNDPNATGTPQEQALGALASGGAQAALGTMFAPNQILERGLGEKAFAGLGGLARTGIEAAGTGGALAGEQAIQQFTQKQYDPSFQYQPAAIGEAAAGGALLGGGFGALGVAARKLRTAPADGTGDNPTSGIQETAEDILRSAKTETPPPKPSEPVLDESRAEPAPIDAVKSRVDPATVFDASGFQVGTGTDKGGNTFRVIGDPKTGDVLEIPQDISNTAVYFRGELVPGGRVMDEVARAVQNGERATPDVLMAAARHAWEFRRRPQTLIKIGATSEDRQRELGEGMIDRFTPEQRARFEAGTPEQQSAWMDQLTSHEAIPEIMQARIHPLWEAYGIQPVKLTSEMDDALIAWTANHMAFKGLVPVAKVDNQLFFARPEDRAQLYHNFGVDRSLPADSGLLERIGVLLKKESGESMRVNIDGVKNTHDSTTHDGVMYIVRGARLNQGVALRRVNDPDGNWHYEADKGIGRSPLQDMDYTVDPNTGEVALGGTKKDALGRDLAEEESVNTSLQLGGTRNDVSGDLQVHRMFPVARQSQGNANLQQILFSLENPTGFLGEDLGRLQAATPAELLTEASRLKARWLPYNLFVNPTQALSLMFKPKAFAARGYMLSSTLVDPGSVKLLPETYVELNKQFREIHGRNLQEGDTILLHRDPALPNQTSMAPYRFGGLMQLQAMDSHRGMVVHPKDPAWKLAAGDFDGDSAVALIPTDMMRAAAHQPPAQPLDYVRSGDAKRMPFPEGTDILNTAAMAEQDPVKRRQLLQTDAIAQELTRRADPFSQQIGRIVSQASKLAEIGLLDHPVVVDAFDPKTGERTGGKMRMPIRDLIAAIAQGSISAKKKAVWADRAKEAFKSVLAGVERERPINRDEAGRPVAYPATRSYMNEVLNKFRRAKADDKEAAWQKVVDEANYILQERARGHAPAGYEVRAALAERVLAVDRLYREIGYFDKPEIPAPIRKAAMDEVAGDTKSLRFVESLSARWNEAAARLRKAEAADDEAGMEAAKEDFHDLRVRAEIAYQRGDVSAAALLYKGPARLAAELVRPEELDRIAARAREHATLDAQFVPYRVDPRTGRTEQLPPDQIEPGIYRYDHRTGRFAQIDTDTGEFTGVQLQPAISRSKEKGRLRETLQGDLSGIRTRLGDVVRVSEVPRVGSRPQRAGVVARTMRIEPAEVPDRPQEARLVDPRELQDEITSLSERLGRANDPYTEAARAQRLANDPELRMRLADGLDEIEARARGLANNRQLRETDFAAIRHEIDDLRKQLQRGAGTSPGARRPQPNTHPPRRPQTPVEEDRAAARQSASINLTRMQKVASYLSMLLGMPNVRMLSAVDLLEALREKRVGGSDAYQAAAKEALFKPSNRGMTVEMADGSKAIYVRADAHMNDALQLKTMAHELGHHVMRSHFDNLRTTDPDLHARIVNAWRAWARRKGWHPKQIDERLAAGEITPEEADASRYRGSLHEWLADQAGGWMTTAAAPKTVIEKWFAGLADKIRELFHRLTQMGHKPAKSVSEFMDNLMREAGTRERVLGRMTVEPETGGRVTPEGVPQEVVRYNRMLRIRQWAATSQPDIGGLRDLVREIGAHLEEHLTPEDARDLRMMAIGPDMRPRLISLLKGSPEELNAIEQNPDVAAGYMFALSVAKILNVDPNAGKLLNKLGAALRERSQVIEHTGANVNAAIEALRSSEPLPEGPFLEPPALAGMLWQGRTQRATRALEMGWRKVEATWRKATTWYIDVPYQRMLDTGRPELVGLARRIQPMAWEHFGLKAGGFLERARVQFQAQAGHVADILEGLTADESANIRDLLFQVPGTRPLSLRARKAVAQLQQVLRDLYTYEKRQGLPVAERKWYFPFVLKDEDVASNLNEVANLFTSHGSFQLGWQQVRENYLKHIEENVDLTPRQMLAVRSKIHEMSDKEFAKLYLSRKVEYGLHSIRDELAQNDQVHNPGFRFQNSRDLDFLLHSGDAEMHRKILGFVETDVRYLMDRYIRAATKRAEFNTLNQQMGGGFARWAAFARSRGATDQDINLARNYIDATNGMLGTKQRDMLDEWIERHGDIAWMQKFHSGGKGIMSDRLSNLQQALLVFEDVTRLTLSVFASFIDPLGQLLKHGDGKIFMDSFRYAFGHLHENLRLNPTQAEHYLNTAGIMDRAFTKQMLFDTFFTGYGVNARNPTMAARIVTTFFKYNGVEWLAQKTRAMNGYASLLTIAKWKHEADTAAPKVAERARQSLRELGLMPEDVVLDTDGLPKVLSWEERHASQTQGGNVERDRDDRLRVAIHRFVDESSVRPDATNKPLIASNPYFALMTQWKTFTTAFDNQILRPVWNRLMDEHRATPMVWMALTFIPMMLFADMLRDAAKTALDPNNPTHRPNWKRGWTLGDHVTYAVQRAGMLGRYQLLDDVIDPLMKGNVPRAATELLGPASSTALDIAKHGPSERQIPTNDLWREWGPRQPVNPNQVADEGSRSMVQFHH